MEYHQKQDDVDAHIHEIAGGKIEDVRGEEAPYNGEIRTRHDLSPGRGSRQNPKQPGEGQGHELMADDDFQGAKQPTGEVLCEDAMDVAQALQQLSGGMSVKSGSGATLFKIFIPERPVRQSQ